MILAFHSVGIDLEADKAADIFDRVMDVGAVLPAQDRLSRKSMREKCFDIQAEGVDYLDNVFSIDAHPTAMRALRRLAKEKIEELPKTGSTQTLFNCTDLLGGELDKVFLSVGSWMGGNDNGFVFDAETLVELGGSLRKVDLGYLIQKSILAVVKTPFKSEREAIDRIEVTIAKKLKKEELTGRKALAFLEEFAKGRCEIVWPGPLPLMLALSGWRVGEHVF